MSTWVLMNCSAKNYNCSAPNYTVMIHTINALLRRDPNSTANISLDNFNKLIDCSEDLNYLTNHIGFSLETFTYIQGCSHDFTEDVLTIVTNLKKQKNIRFNFLTQSLQFVCFRNLLGCCADNNCPYICKPDSMSKIHIAVMNELEAMNRPQTQEFTCGPRTDSFFVGNECFVSAQPSDALKTDQKTYVAFQPIVNGIPNDHKSSGNPFI